MVDVEAVLGVWSKPTPDMLKGVAGSGLRAYGLAGGDEADKDYSVLCDVKLTAGELAGVIIGYSQAEDYSERYAECILDVSAQQIYCKLVYGDQSVVVYNRSYTLVLGSTYHVKATIKTEDDGSGTLIFSVDGVVQLRVESLASVYTAGLYGFSVEGALASDYAEFTNVQQFLEPPYGSLDMVKRLCGLSDSSAKDADLLSYMLDASRWVDVELKKAGATVPLTTVPDELDRVVNYYGAGKFLQRDTAEDKEHSYVSAAKMDLSAYIIATYGSASSGLAPIIVSRMIDDD